MPPQQIPTQQPPQPQQQQPQQPPQKRTKALEIINPLTGKNIFADGVADNSSGPASEKETVGLFH